MLRRLSRISKGKQKAYRQLLSTDLGAPCLPHYTLLSEHFREDRGLCALKDCLVVCKVSCKVSCTSRFMKILGAGWQRLNCVQPLDGKQQAQRLPDAGTVYRYVSATWGEPVSPNC